MDTGAIEVLGLPPGEAGSRRETDERLMRVLNCFYFSLDCAACPVYFCGVQSGFQLPKPQGKDVIT